MHDTSSEEEPPLTANSHGSPQASASVTTALTETAPAEPVHGQDWSKLHVRPLFHPGEQVLVKAGLVPKVTLLYRGPYTLDKVLGR